MSFPEDRDVLTILSCVGGNANVILQDVSNLEKVECDVKDGRTYHVVTLSAQPHTPFQSIIARFSHHLENTKNEDLSSLSYTTTARRVDYPVRLAFGVSSIQDLKEQLRRSTGARTKSDKTKATVGFVIGGNGSQFRGMGKTLYETSPPFRAEVEKCDEIFRKCGGPGFLGVITGDTDPFDPTYENFLCTSICVFAIGYALGMLWKEWAINPSVILGHSLGEFAAFALAGCLTVEDAVQLIIWRSQAIYADQATSLGGGMIVVGLGEVDAKELLKDSGCQGLVISCYNGPAQTCFSGDSGELLKLQAFAQSLPQVPLIKLLQSKIPWHSPNLRKKITSCNY